METLLYMHMPVTYNVVKIGKQGENIDLELVNSNNDADAFKIRLKKSIPPQKIRSFISAAMESRTYISYFFNYINDNGTLGDPIQLSSIKPDTEIAWKDIGNLKQLLYINEFCYIE